jgi:hypothetical protein
MTPQPRVHLLKRGTEHLGDYREAVCGSYNRGTLRFTQVPEAATCVRCAPRPLVQAVCACGVTYKTRRPRVGGLCFRCFFKKDTGRDVIVERGPNGAVVLR